MYKMKAYRDERSCFHQKSKTFYKGSLDIVHFLQTPEILYLKQNK